MAVGTGRAVDEGECQIFRSQRGFIMPDRGAGLLAKAERSLAMSCMSWVLVVVIRDVTRFGAVVGVFRWRVLGVVV